MLKLAQLRSSQLVRYQPSCFAICPNCWSN